MYRKLYIHVLVLSQVICIVPLNLQMEMYHQAWLEDIAIRLLCVLALDRFGDFVSDAVVAPVRETCAQCLGAVLRLMNDSGIQGVLQVLLQLLQQNEWEARHGGLLGLKYLLAVKAVSIANCYLTTDS